MCGNNIKWFIRFLGRKNNAKRNLFKRWRGRRRRISSTSNATILCRRLYFTHFGVISLYPSHYFVKISQTNWNVAIINKWIPPLHLHADRWIDATEIWAYCNSRNPQQVRRSKRKKMTPCANKKKTKQKRVGTVYRKGVVVKHVLYILLCRSCLREKTFLCFIDRNHLGVDRL